jgi:hypothetical protein
MSDRPRRAELQLCAEYAQRTLNMSQKMELQPDDFHLTVKSREGTDKPWRWEIWAAGKAKAVAQSEHQFATMSQAKKEGKAALKALLQKKFPNANAA